MLKAKRRNPRNVVVIGVNIVNITKITILKRKSMKDIVTELNTTTSLGKLILSIIPALFIKEVRPMRTASVNRFIIMIPRSSPILYDSSI
jgi:hypothetical protein